MLGLFRRAPAFRLDRTFGCSKLQGVRHRLHQGKFRAVGKALSKCGGIDERTFLIDALAEAEDQPACFEDWVGFDPTSSSALTVRGAHALEWAWHARTFSRSEDVSEQQWEQFADRLSLARASLEHALAIDPGESAAYAYLLRCALGQAWELEETTALYNQARDFEPAPWLATYNYFVFLCQKWFGSHELMFEFARAVSGSAPEGSDVHALVAHAHIERWLYAGAFDNSPDPDNYWRSDDVFEELIDVYKLWVNKTSNSPYELVAANAFLFCFASMSARQVVDVELERIGPFPTYTPWRYLGDPVAVYRELWNGAVARGARL